MRARRQLRKKREAISRIGLATAGSPVFGETTLCLARLCPWAHACRHATPRPALVGQRQCLRRYAEDMRPPGGLSGHALDVLAAHREQGLPLGAVTLVMLDQFRPDGPPRRGAAA